MIVETDIISIVAAGKIQDRIYYLPAQQFDRKTYEVVNKCLVNLGGKWNRKEKGHVFDFDPEDAISNLILTGESVNQKKIFQFFPTPEKIAEKLCDLAELTSDNFVLEPSCSKGDLADVIYKHGVKVLGIELNKDMERYLEGKPYPVHIGIDFLEFAKDLIDNATICEWDRIIMNPPFSRQQDIDHIYAAWSILNKGILVSVMSPSPFFRENKKSMEFRDFLERHDAEVIDVPEGEFNESGTAIRTKIIKIIKP